MIVYGSSMSPFVRKVLAFAAEKGIAVESRPVGLGSDDPEFLDASPFRKIPAMRDGDFTVSDSTAIIAYMDAIKPDPALIPADPRERARVMWFDEFADTMLGEAGRKIFFNRIVAPRFLKREGDAAVADKAQAEELPPLLDYLERQIPDTGFLVGDRLTLADIAVASPFANLGHCGIGFGDRPRLAAYSAAILARPSLASWVDKETRFFARTA